MERCPDISGGTPRKLLRGSNPKSGGAIRKGAPSQNPGHAPLEGCDGISIWSPRRVMAGNCGVYSDQAEKPALTQRDQTLVSSHAVSTGPKPSDSAGKLTAWPPLAKFIPF